MELKNEIIKPGMVLMTIAIVSAFFLSYVFTITDPVIKEKKEQVFQDSMKVVLPNADSFDKVGDVYIGVSGKAPVGMVKKILAPGYSSVLELLVGIDYTNSITGIVVLYQQETPGLGANVVKDEFLNQIIGKTKDDIKLWKDGGEVDAITGATVTSRAVTNALYNFLKPPQEDTVTGATAEWEDVI